MSSLFPYNRLPSSVTEADIDRLFATAIATEHVTNDVHTGKPKVLSIEYQLENDFTIHGRAACVSPETFDLDIGRSIALTDARSKAWGYLGFHLQQLRHEADSRSS